MYLTIPLSSSQQALGIGKCVVHLADVSFAAPFRFKVVPNLWGLLNDISPYKGQLSNQFKLKQLINKGNLFKFIDSINNLAIVKLYKLFVYMLYFW